MGYDKPNTRVIGFIDSSALPRTSGYESVHICGIAAAEELEDSSKATKMYREKQFRAAFAFDSLASAKSV